MVEAWLAIPCVYILASGFNGTLYIGVTGDVLGGSLFISRPSWRASPSATA